MTPADIIRPIVKVASERKPHLRIDNRMPSCFELLEDSVRGGGPDWAFIGKSSKRGESGYRPSWFSPQWVACKRPDGETESVMIDLLGMDAAWYLPSGRQVKVITNSTANDDPRPEIHGPAGLDSYDIDPKDYRWHNPPVPQRDGVVVTPMPQPGPTPAPATGNLPDRQEMMNAGRWLDSYYRSAEGLQRSNGLSINGAPDWEGVGAWLFDVYLKARLRGKNATEATAEVVSEIRHAGGPNGEWRVKHPGETP